MSCPSKILMIAGRLNGVLGLFGHNDAQQVIEWILLAVGIISLLWYYAKKE